MKRKIFLSFLILFSTSLSAADLNKKYAVYLENDTVSINTYTPKIINIVADSNSIYKNAKIKVIFPKIFSEFAWDEMFWLIFPPNVRAGYTKIKSKSTNKKGIIQNVTLTNDEFPTTPSSAFHYAYQHENNQKMLTFQMLDTLPKGDTLQIIYGANGTTTFTSNSMVEHADNFVVLIDNQNSGNFDVIEKQPTIYVKHLVAKSINLVLSSKGNLNNTSLLKVAIHDVGKNVVNDFTGSVQITSSDASALTPLIINFNATDKGTKDVYLNFAKNGIYTIKANVLSANQPLTGNFFSNPINVSNDSFNIYWGEFHTHTKFSRDGFGSDAYSYARYGAGLDFYSGTDHMDCNPIDTFGINTLEWNALQSEARLVNEPSRFVSFLGYENSLENPSGHYNFIFNYKEDSINNIPQFTRYLIPNIKNIWTQLNALNWQGKMLTIPHHTGKIFGLIGPDNGATEFGGTYKNETYKRNIEIYSGHGMCEYYNPSHNLAYEQFSARSTTFPAYAQDAWALGEKLSVVSSTDSHNGRMAFSNSGITAIIADSLNRNSLFTALYNRHTYGTTGERIYLNFKIGNSIMGDELTVHADSFPTLFFEVNGTDNLDKVELLKWDFKKGKYTIAPIHPIYTTVHLKQFNSNTKNYSFSYIDSTLTDTSLYYIRVKQKNKVNSREVWAWTSPIWINKTHTTLPILSDSLFNFQLKFNNQKVSVEWCMKDALNTNYFVIERSQKDSLHFTSLDTIQTAHIAYFDSCYKFIDNHFFDSTLFYRIKVMGYNDSIRYSNIQKIIVPYTRDSVFNLNVTVQSDHIKVEWNARELKVMHYDAQKMPKTSNYQSFENIINQDTSYYFVKDFMPIKDSSFYRIKMNLNDSSFLFSNIDTLIYFLDSITFFKTILHDNDIAITWKGMHENKLLKYEVQRSNDKNLFFNIQTILPIGTTFDTVEYTYNDTSYMYGWNYYRIVQYLQDGNINMTTLDSQYVFNTSIHINSNSDIDFKIMNNIIHGGVSYLNVLTQANTITEGEFMIIGVDGRIMHQQNNIISKNESFVSIPISQLSSGFYYLLFYNKYNLIKKNFIIEYNGTCGH